MNCILIDDINKLCFINLTYIERADLYIIVRFKIINTKIIPEYNVNGLLICFDEDNLEIVNYNDMDCDDYE
jgi:hypothetical protein